MRFVLVITITFIFSACRKDKGLPFVDAPSNNPPVYNNFVSFSFPCDTLPKEPGFGWMDTTTNDYHNIYFWAYNPANSNEIIYVNYLGELYTYNLKTTLKIFLDNNIMSLPQINKNGWIAYDKLSFQVFVVKTNGDSLQLLNSSIAGKEPHWDYSSKYVYYRQNGNFMKISQNGVKIDSTSLNPNCIAFAKTSDNYLFVSSINVYLKNVVDNSQTFLFSDPNNILHSTFSNDDKVVYWWDYKSLQSFNMETKKRDTLIRFCENFSIRGLNVSANSDKLTMSLDFKKQIGSRWKLYRENIPIEMDVNTKEWRKLLVQF